MTPYNEPHTGEHKDRPGTGWNRNNCKVESDLVLKKTHTGGGVELKAGLAAQSQLLITLLSFRRQ